MKIVILDSQPLVGYFEKEDYWETIADYFSQATDERCMIFMTTVNFGEVYYAALRAYGEEHADNVLATMKNLPIRLVDVDKELAIQAGRFKARGGLSYADCFAAALAKLRKGELVTGDKEFKVVEKEIKIMWV